jgi:hypothetical protein
MFCNEIVTFTFFSTDQIQKLRCYQVSMNVGAANICGFMKDNIKQKSYLEQALTIIENIGLNVKDPYGDGSDFSIVIMKIVCRKKHANANYFLRRQLTTLLTTAM